MSPEVEKMTKHLHLLQEFTTSSTHTNFVSARRAEIESVKNRILTLRPDTQLNIGLQLQAFGELDCLEEMVTTFEDAVLTLKDRISKKTDLEHEEDTTQKL